ncbi:MAG: FAD-binding protein [Bacteroidales bacterium]|nr:FAD-binding protein [Bacteroidales bacterium]
MIEDFEKLATRLKGEIRWDTPTLLQYATDASAYREIPKAVVWPKGKSDLQELVSFAQQQNLTLTPRTAGTSLAGQVVSNGVIVDLSKYWGKIIEVNQQEHYVWVEPGVILDELNLYLKPYGLFFAPETSTSNRCMIGGMVGNNSCGSHSLIYGSTRDHLLSVRIMLDDGEVHEFSNLTYIEFEAKCKLSNREGEIYRFFEQLLGKEGNRKLIAENSPDPSLRRRNSGYALDHLATNTFFNGSTNPFNLAKLVAGSEGTLGIVTEIKLNLVPLPPKEKAVVAVHLEKREQAFRANLIALKYYPAAVELMDNVILNCTKGNIEQQKNRFFVQGEPGAILMVEFYGSNQQEIEEVANEMENEMRLNGYGYYFPIIWGNETTKVWALRKAGLGVLSNVIGDAKPVSLVEDTAVAVEKLPDYMEEFAGIMGKYNLDCVYHAHIGTGELHLRPVLNLKDPNDVELFRKVGLEVASLVKKYRGSLSGEHGDGRLRGEFIPFMYGNEVYQMMLQVKKTFDPNNIFNQGKIVNTPPMNTSLRYQPGIPTREIATIFDFSGTQGIIRAIEKCNGSGDCRKTHRMGGTMCPSYMATLNEANTTRARANLLREYLTNSPKDNPFDHKELYEVLDLCLMCKGCKSECPSSVDMTKLKAEFLQHWYDIHGIPFRNKMVAYITQIYRLGAIFPKFTNLLLSSKVTSFAIKNMLGFAQSRALPKLSSITLRRWQAKQKNSNKYPNGIVYLLPDEFTNFNESHIGVKAAELLNYLGYEVRIPDILESGRTYISKGLIRTAKRIANNNIDKLKGIIGEDTPLVGIEPSAILSFRDEYPDLADDRNTKASKELAMNSLLFEEFFMREASKGKIAKEHFKQGNLRIKLHGHCQQKAVASTQATKAMLSFPEGYEVSEIPSGCCGMAGSFGFEKEHYELSMKIGELVLFPEIRKSSETDVIVAPGTSCRQQIYAGTGRYALHPIEVMWQAANISSQRS